jgi:queuine tRNA-ribosyltransferase
MRYAAFKFITQADDLPNRPGRARLGWIATPHGVVETPNFILCATKAALKAATPAQAKAHQTQIILSNTYHLMLQPGADLVAKMGGLHRFMGWDGPMLTDSGGFQVFSLGHGGVAAEVKGRRVQQRPKTLLKITEHGAEFRSYIDGSKHVLTPEKSIEVQHKLGADLVVVFDECTPFHVPYEYTKKSMYLSHRWAVRSLQRFDQLNTGAQALYGIIQGGIHKDLRAESTEFVNSQPFFGHAIGGSLGANKQQMQEVVEFTASSLVTDRPIHLLGIGGTIDIFHGVEQGIDTFDCVHPTRLARHGGALVPAAVAQETGAATGREHLNLRNAQFREDAQPIDTSCFCETCRTFSRAYLHHLLRSQELLALQAITVHNIAFMSRLMKDIRNGLRQGDLNRVKKFYLG